MGLSSNMQGFPSGLNGLGNGGLRVEHPGTHASPSDLRSTASDGDQLIPTAIVIKNIPFAVRKETLASIMLELHLPQPYAFNYHFDNGVFRGLAFANFQSAEDTRIVIEAMNGMDVHGRKLRVEYKKMLPEAERERIEREKRERRGQLEEQHRAPLLHQQSSIQSLGSMAQAQARGTPSHSGKCFQSLIITTMCKPLLTSATYQSMQATLTSTIPRPSNSTLSWPCSRGMSRARSSSSLPESHPSIDVPFTSSRITWGWNINPLVKLIPVSLPC